MPLKRKTWMKIPQPQAVLSSLVPKRFSKGKSGNAIKGKSISASDSCLSPSSEGSEISTDIKNSHGPSKSLSVSIKGYQGLEDEVIVKSPHHSQRLPSDLHALCLSRCDNPYVREFRVLEEIEVRNVSPCPSPAEYPHISSPSDCLSGRSQEEILLSCEDVHRYLVRSPPPVLARGPQAQSFVFPQVSPLKEHCLRVERCLSAGPCMSDSCTSVAFAEIGEKHRSLPGTPRRFSNTEEVSEWDPLREELSSGVSHCH